MFAFVLGAVGLVLGTYLLLRPSSRPRGKPDASQPDFVRHGDAPAAAGYSHVFSGVWDGRAFVGAPTFLGLCPITRTPHADLLDHLSRERRSAVGFDATIHPHTLYVWSIDERKNVVAHVSYAPVLS